MNFLNYIIRRLLLLIVVLIGVTLIIFALLSLFTPEQRASAFIRDIKQLEHLDSIIKTYKDPAVICAFTAAILRVPRSLFTARVARAATRSAARVAL